MIIYLGRIFAIKNEIQEPVSPEKKVKKHFPTLALSKSGNRSKVTLPSQPIYKLPSQIFNYKKYITIQQNVNIKTTGWNV